MEFSLLALSRTQLKKLVSFLPQESQTVFNEDLKNLKKSRLNVYLKSQEFNKEEEKNKGTGNPCNKGPLHSAEQEYFTASQKLTSNILQAVLNELKSPDILFSYNTKNSQLNLNDFDFEKLLKLTKEHPENQLLKNLCIILIHNYYQFCFKPNDSKKSLAEKFSNEQALLGVLFYAQNDLGENKKNINSIAEVLKNTLFLEQLSTAEESAVKPSNQTTEQTINPQSAEEKAAIIAIESAEKIEEMDIEKKAKIIKQALFLTPENILKDSHTTLGLDSSVEETSITNIKAQVIQQKKNLRITDDQNNNSDQKISAAEYQLLKNKYQKTLEIEYTSFLTIQELEKKYQAQSWTEANKENLLLQEAYDFFFSQVCIKELPLKQSTPDVIKDIFSKLKNLSKIKPDFPFIQKLLDLEGLGRY